MKTILASTTNNTITIESVEQLASEMTFAVEESKRSGQFITLYIEKPVDLAAFPTDGSEKIRRDKSFQPQKAYQVQLHFSADYEKAMAKALGVDEYHKSADTNRETIVPNVLMRYISTNNVCFVHMPTQYLNKRYMNEYGEPLSEEQVAYMNHYKKAAKAEILPYRTISIKYVKSIAMGGQRYILNIPAAQAERKTA